MCLTLSKILKLSGNIEGFSKWMVCGEDGDRQRCKEAEGSTASDRMQLLNDEQCCTWRMQFSYTVSAIASCFIFPQFIFF